jgi:CheY-like chemotaxis protein
LDDMMPGMDGGMVLDALRDELGHSTPPAVLLTASGNQTERAREMGAVLGLCKPFQVEELLLVVDRYRRGYEPDA